MTLNSISPLMGEDAVDFEIARTRDLAFDAVQSLWRRRQSEGMSQADLAQKIDRDEAWVSRNLRGPGNWTLRTLARFANALDGEIALHLFALEDPAPTRDNYNAYAELDAQLFEARSSAEDHKRIFNQGRLETSNADAVLSMGANIVAVVEIKKGKVRKRK